MFFLLILISVFNISSSVNTCPEFVCENGSFGNSLVCFTEKCTQKFCCNNRNCIDDYDSTLCASGITLNVPCTECDILECCEHVEFKEPSPTPNRSLRVLAVPSPPDSCPFGCYDNCGGNPCNNADGNTNGNKYCSDNGLGKLCCSGAGCGGNGNRETEFEPSPDPEPEPAPEPEPEPAPESEPAPEPFS